MSNWTNGYCDGDYDYSGPYQNNKTYTSNKCLSGSGYKYMCVTDPDFENWAGEAKYNKNQYSSCSPYYGPFTIWAYPPSCIRSTNGTRSNKYVCSTTSKTLNLFTYSPSAFCNGTYGATSNTIDECETGSYDKYYSCQLSILPGVAFLARGNNVLGTKVINKIFIGGIFSAVLLGVFLVLLGLTILFYYRRIYRPLKKMIIELSNNDDSNKNVGSLENVGVGSFCAWLCCGNVNNAEIKKLAE